MRYKKILLPIILTIAPLLLLILTSGGTVSPVVKPSNDQGAIVEDEAQADKSYEENVQRVEEQKEDTIDEGTNKPGNGAIEEEGVGTLEGTFNSQEGSINPHSGGFAMESKNLGNRGTTRTEIVGSPVFAKITHDTKLYNTVNGGVSGDIEKGEQVEILQDRTCTWYEVSIHDTVAWIKSDALEIPPDPPTETTRLADEELEDFINNKDFDSYTSNFLWVDIHRQLVYAFEKVDDQWELIRTMVCSTGINESPTTRGLFAISDRDTWMYTKRLGSGAKYWVRFNNTYLFHSVAFAEDGQTIIDDTLGERSSAGCIRLSLEDSKWIYENMKEGTGVWVN